MPITMERMLGVLDAAEDYQQALRAARATLERELGAARQTGNFQGALENLDLLLTEGMLLHEPIESPLALRAERQHFSPGRVHANYKAAGRQRRLRLPIKPKTKKEN